MKKITLSNLLLLINQKTNDLSYKYNEVLRNALVIKDRELDGTETVLQDIKDFDEVMEDYKTEFNTLLSYKNTLAKANATVEVEVGMTIIEAINTISMLRRRLDLFNSLSLNKPTLDRRFDGNGSSSYYKVKDLNYDIDEILREKEEIKNEIARLESLVQNVNATTFVEV